MAYYPVNETIPMPPGSTIDEWAENRFASRNNQTIAAANEALRQLAAECGCTYIDVNAGLMDEQGRLKAEYTTEGIHMTSQGYEVVLSNLMQYL